MVRKRKEFAKENTSAAVKEVLTKPSNETSTSTVTDNRKDPRIATDLKAIVQFQQASGDTWKEVTKILTISKSGASFYLSRTCQVGCLVTLVMPLPIEFRAYDFTAELYPVIGLVQYCYESVAEGEQVHYMGVAFVGKRFPEGHIDNPCQNYHIAGTTATGMWNIAPSNATFKVRSAPRFWTSFDAGITLIKKERTENNKEVALTTNVSISGASVQCSLDAKTGDRVKFGSKEYDFYTIAIVRNRQEKKGQTPILHLEFIDSKFPVEKIAARKVTAVTDNIGQG